MLRPWWKGRRGRGMSTPFNGEPMPRLTRAEVRAEVLRLRKILAYESTHEGIDYYVNNIGLSDPGYITQRLVEYLMEDADKRGYNIAAMFGEAILRLRGQRVGDRDQYNALFNWSGEAAKPFMDRLDEAPKMLADG